MNEAATGGSAEARLRDEICAFGRSLFDRGLSAGSSGNISARTPDGFLITPTNSSLGRLDPVRLAKLGRDGRLVLATRHRRRRLFTLRSTPRPEAGAIVHLHATYSAAVSCMDGLDHANCIPPLTPYFVMKIGRLPLAPYFRPGDPALAKAVESLQATWLRLARQPRTRGVRGDLRAAVYAIEELEETAKLFLLLRGSRVRPLSCEEIEDVERVFGPRSDAKPRSTTRH